jgi:hypothetical protein
MNKKYKYLIYIIAIEIIILLVFSLNSNKILKHFKNNRYELTCNRINFTVDNIIALKHYKDNVRIYMPEFNKCYSKQNAINLIQIINDDNNNNTIQIKINDLLNRYQLNNISLIKCYAQLFSKKLNVKERAYNLKKSKKYYFNKKFKLIVNQHGFYHIACSIYTNNDVFFEDIRLILPKNMSKLKNNFTRYSNNKTNDFDLINESKCKSTTNTDNNNNRMNVFILGIDSLSYPHLKRSFPLFYQYLSENLSDNIFFENFNKIGENTYPNLLAMLAGIKETELDSYYYKLDSTYHDQMPFIWKLYEQHLDYLTLYNEEWSYYGCFNYLKQGFRSQPTHYYAHPYWFQYDKLMSRNNNSKLCLNNEPTYSKSLNKIKQLIEQLNNNESIKQPYFSFNFLKYYTHDYLVVPPGYDAQLTDLIRTFEKNGYFNNTLLVFMSDHGSRLTQYGFYTEPGRQERSMPFLSIRLPKHLKSRDFYLKALNNNKYNLVTMFDLYKTLKHFFYINKYGLNDKLLINNKECRFNFSISLNNQRSMRGISLFENIDSNRSCKDALVPSSYCLCSPSIEINESIYKNETNYSFNQSALFITEYINELTLSQRNICMPFKLKEIKTVKKIVYTTDINLFQFQIVLHPGQSVFEANLKVNNLKQLELFENKVNRLSKYRNQSSCVANSVNRLLMGFCYCNSL